MAHKTIRISIFAVITLLASALFSSCKKMEGDLELEILRTTLWAEEHESDNETEEYIYDFGEGGLVDIYLLEDNVGTLEQKCRYIYNPTESILAIETFSPMKVIELSVNTLRIQFLSGNKQEVTLKRYNGDISLEK